VANFVKSYGGVRGRAMTGALRADLKAMDAVAYPGRWAIAMEKGVFAIIPIGE
jgi:hypothetical protein